MTNRDANPPIVQLEVIVVAGLDAEPRVRLSFRLQKEYAVYVRSRFSFHLQSSPEDSPETPLVASSSLVLTRTRTQDLPVTSP